MAGTLKEKIYASIVDRIMLGEFSRDTCLSEVRLAEQFAVSRAPVREALVALCNAGILQNIPRVGYRIVAISPREFTETLAVRQLLEREAATLAVRNLTPEQALVVDELIREELTGEHGPLLITEWMQHGDAIHFALARFSGNQVLEALILELMRKLRRACTQLYLQHNRADLKSSRYHLKILRALKARNEPELLANLALDIDLTHELLGMIANPGAGL